MNTSKLNDRMELAALAHKRYPKEDLLTALMWFQSDRRRAGLGALDERRRHGRLVQRFKTFDQYKCQITYHLRTKILAHMELQVSELPLRIHDMPQNEYSTVERIPERTGAICYGCSADDFCSQRGRNRLARALMGARRELAQNLQGDKK